MSALKELISDEMNRKDICHESMKEIYSDLCTLKQHLRIAQEKVDALERQAHSHAQQILFDGKKYSKPQAERGCDDEPKQAQEQLYAGVTVYPDGRCSLCGEKHTPNPYVCPDADICNSADLCTHARIHCLRVGEHGCVFKSGVPCDKPPFCIPYAHEQGGGDWQKRATEFLKNGGCPICFCSAEEEHTKDCAWGVAEKFIDNSGKIQDDLRDRLVRAEEREKKTFDNSVLVAKEHDILCARLAATEKLLSEITKSSGKTMENVHEMRKLFDERGTRLASFESENKELWAAGIVKRRLDNIDEFNKDNKTCG